MKIDKSTRRIFIYSLAGVILIFVFIFSGLLKYEAQNFLRMTSRKAACKNCDDFFSDNVKTHDLAYKTEGIKPQKELTALDKLKEKGVLVELESCDNYTLRDMDHSRPYVLPKVKTFLEELTELYKKELGTLPYVPFEITSATRSKRTVRELIGNNVNAITNSAHLKGKTIDISYLKFGENTEQLSCFISAMKSLHENKKCFVKYEKSQACLHITVR